MINNIFRFSGLISVAVGLMFLVNSFSGLTGLVILEDIDSAASSVLGIVFLLGGIGLFAVSQTREEARRTRESPLVGMANGLIPAEKRRSAVIVYDADFLKTMQKTKVGYSLQDDWNGGYHVQLLDHVENELVRVGGSFHGGAGAGNRGLIDQKLIRNLWRLGTEPIDGYEPRSGTEDHILSLWRRHASNRNSSRDEQKFRNGADIKLLSYAFDRGSNYTIILSKNSTDYRGVSEALRKEGVNVYIRGYDDIFGR